MLFVTILAAVVGLVMAQYELQSTFAGLTFFDNFNFWTSWDPTYGFVHYVDQAVAKQHNMINITDASVSWGVDTTQKLDPDANLGRLSLRLISIQSWTHGLFILDLSHMPSNTCGVWPAFWTLGSGLWPTTGEIDIIEFVNNLPNNLMALHTSEICSVAGADETGTLLSADCGAAGGITGCTVGANAEFNSGAAFNDNGGGVYAMEWTSTAIRIWFFPRNAIPDSITSGVPDTNSFGVPIANFEGNCDIDAHFFNHSLVFDIDFCGQYAGNVWQADGCPMLEATNGWSSCNDFVALNPHAFVETYWEVNYLKVYQLPSGAVPTSTSSLSSVTPAISTSAVSASLSNAQGRTNTPTMSLAGTVPSITTGTFTVTSSVLSVLSSLSTASEASASSASAGSRSASLVGRATSVSTLSTGTISIRPSGNTFTSASTSPTTSRSASDSKSATLIASSTVIQSSTAQTSGSSLSGTTSCLGNSCATITVVETVVATVTINPTGQEPLNSRTAKDKVNVDNLEPRRVLGFHHATPTAYSPGSVPVMISPPPLDPRADHKWGGFDLCDFVITGGRTSDNCRTKFSCTQTKEEVFNGTLLTETFIESTMLPTQHPLDLGSILSIDEITMKTVGTAENDVYFGSFTPSGAHVLSTTLTAYPEVTSSDPTASKTCLSQNYPSIHPRNTATAIAKRAEVITDTKNEGKQSNVRITKTIGASGVPTTTGETSIVVVTTKSTVKPASETSSTVVSTTTVKSNPIAKTRTSTTTVSSVSTTAQRKAETTGSKSNEAGSFVLRGPSFIIVASMLIVAMAV